VVGEYQLKVDIINAGHEQNATGHSRNRSTRHTQTDTDEIYMDYDIDVIHNWLAI